MAAPLAAPTDAAVLEALRAVRDPDLHQDIVSLGFVKDLRVCGGNVAFSIELTTPACPVKDLMKAQAEQVFRNLDAALTAAGAKFSDVVKMNTYTTNMSQLAAIREVRARYFGDAAPASTLIGVPALANPAFMLEVEVIAAVAQPGR